MLLAIDIGNTNMTVGIFKKARVMARYSIPTHQDSYLGAFRKILHRRDVDSAVICSVVPKASCQVERDLKRLGLKQPIIIGKDLTVPIKNLYRKPNQVGQDRLVNAYAGSILHGSPLIVVDFGTAVTFDCISKQKAYLGGLILPGLRISLKALRENTALLPSIELAKPKELIGRDTKNSMLSGIVYGLAAASDDLAVRIKQKFGRKTTVIGTGGNIGLIAKFCKQINIIDQDLTLKGLQLIHAKSK